MMTRNESLNALVNMLVQHWELESFCDVFLSTGMSFYGMKVDDVSDYTVTIKDGASTIMIDTKHIVAVGYTNER